MRRIITLHFENLLLAFRLKYLTALLNQNPEQLARDEIDKQLLACGWVIQSTNQINLNAGMVTHCTIIVILNPLKVFTFHRGVQLQNG